MTARGNQRKSWRSSFACSTSEFPVKRPPRRRHVRILEQAEQTSQPIFGFAVPVMCNDVQLCRVQPRHSGRRM